MQPNKQIPTANTQPTQKINISYASQATNQPQFNIQPQQAYIQQVPPQFPQQFNAPQQQVQSNYVLSQKNQQNYTPQQQIQQNYIPQQQIQLNYIPQQIPNYEQFELQQQMNFDPNCYIQAPISNNVEMRLLKEKDQSKKVAAIIVTFNDGCSYDDLFRSVQQKVMEGTQVLVYACPTSAIAEIFKGMKEEPCSDIVKDLLKNMKEVHPDCVVFNWECCSVYGDANFPEEKEGLLPALKMIIDAGHMVMFSDFSLKALIHSWDEKILGSNPFVKTGETSGEVVLRFKSAVLKECPSAQLQIVGDMAEGNRCNLHTLGSTILYSIDQKKIDKNAYELTLLTINETNVPHNPQYVLNIDGHKGSAGHVLLKYKSGGYLLTSMGHWIELMKVDTSEKKLFEVAEREYGQAYAAEMKMQYASMDTTSQKAYIKNQAVNFIQNQAPCSNMNKKGF